MSLRLQELHEKLKNHPRPGIAWPLVKAEMAMNGRRHFSRKKDLRKTYFEYKDQGADYYAECYRLFAYATFGYGNWSNNDRRRKNLHALR